MQLRQHFFIGAQNVALVACDPIRNLLHGAPLQENHEGPTASRLVQIMKSGQNWETATPRNILAWQWPRSLRGQLALMPTAFLVLGLLATVGGVFLGAKNRIAAEIASGMRLGHDLVEISLRNLGNVDSPALAFEMLAQSLPQVRHIQFDLVPSKGITISDGKFPIEKATYHPRRWIVRLLAPPPVEQIFPVFVRGETVGELRLRPNPRDEIAEIIDEVELFGSVYVGLWLLIVSSLCWTVRRSIRPVQLLADGFDRLERGDYRPIAPIPITELERVGHQFNRLVESLRRVTADNRFLIDKLFSMQDRERKELATELHDELGPALFGIRAEASCIMSSVPRETESHARAQSIAGLTDGIQKVNYRMLDRLRPLVLEQMGLSMALSQLVASWEAQCPHLTWSLDNPLNFDDPAEALSLTLYTVVQESVTNAIRHAQASTISIRLERTKSRLVHVIVRDNGKGLPEHCRYGYGLLGLTERVRLLGGTLTIGDARPGVIVEVGIPETAERTGVEPAHADTAD